MPQPTPIGMEQVHGVDVSWMTQGTPKEKPNRPSPATKTPAPAEPRQIPTPADAPGTTHTNGGSRDSSPSGNGTPAPKGKPRSGSIDRPGQNGTPPKRRGSWFSNMTAKLSGSSVSPSTSLQNPQAQNGQAQSQLDEEQSGIASTQVDVDDPPVPKITPLRGAVLPHANKAVDGSSPYTPAPPPGQSGFLSAFRRLSSSNNTGSGGKIGNGLVERKVFNVDKARERCPINELKDSKLRRVAFCVDVEIAPMPKYPDPDASTPPRVGDKNHKQKATEKGEGDALKRGAAEEAVADGETQPASNDPQSTQKTQPTKLATDKKDDDIVDNAPAVVSLDDDKSAAKDTDKDTSRKKEKKKKSEEERKARKEKKRKLAEANGSVPMELHYDSDESIESSAATTPAVLTPGTGTPKRTGMATTNPVRIYRRCCQLRETPILKKITEQLTDVINALASSGMVRKLDLTDYPMQLPDLVTLGDFLAIVPVREIILENSGLSDEGLRVILAGLLTAKGPDLRRRRPRHLQEVRGGVVERLVVKSNKLGPDGWKHISLFIYLCRSLKYLDLSHVPFPRQTATKKMNGQTNGVVIPRSIAEIFAKSLTTRLGGSGLELLNLGETDLSMDQLGVVMDGIIRCGVPRLGLAHNQLDAEGWDHVSRYLKAGKCEGLDLGGNDMKDHIEKVVSSIKETDPLWALSLAGCNLNPSGLCRILPPLVKLSNCRFIDLSHNADLFKSTPSAVGLLRRYLPKMEHLKRIHLQHVNMSAEQAIALVEVLPEIHNLAHINLLDNTELAALSQAQTEEEQEEACALYASLMAAARISKSIVAIDIEVPGEKAGDIVKAMAKQVVAYCLRNMEQIPEAEAGATLATTQEATAEAKAAGYSDVLAHLVGHDAMDQMNSDDNDSAPDEDYVIGGTGVVKALTFCLKNHGEETHRHSGEFDHETEPPLAVDTSSLPTGGKAKDMSKHLLAGARKIRLRLQPALHKARAHLDDEQNLRKLMFLDDTLKGIIRRFEDEFPDTRVAGVDYPLTPVMPEAEEAPKRGRSTSPVAVEDHIPSDPEDEAESHAAKTQSRSNSRLSRNIAKEEGRVLRAGHRFRSGFLRQEHIDLITAVDEIGSDPNHHGVLDSLAEDLGGEFLAIVKEKGPIRAFKEDKETLFRQMKEEDPDYWEVFLEAQAKARANITTSVDEKKDDSAIVD